MTKIIGHRGASGVALENSRAAFLAAIKHGADMIELDVRLTADDKLVVIHDPNTGRVAAEDAVIREKTLSELRAIKLDNGEIFQSLDETLDLIGGTPVIIEIKDENSVDELLLTLSRHPKARASVASFHPEELRLIRRALPEIPIYALEYLAPIDIIRTARSIHATGIGLNFWLMNPLTYRLVRRYHLDIYAYVNAGKFGEWLMIHAARPLHRLYPELHLCTRHPERFRKNPLKPQSSRVKKTASR